MSNELNKFGSLLQEKMAIEERMKQLSDRIVFAQRIILRKIPKTERVLSKKIKEALSLNKHKLPWINLSIYDSFLEDVYIFGKEESILHNLKRIVKMIVMRKESKIGDVGISLVSGRFSLKDFI